MKKILFVMALGVMGLGVNAQEATKKNAIKLNPLSLAFLTGNVSYERAVGSNQSINLGVFYSGISFDNLKYSGFGLTPEYRFYFAGKKEALNGVYAAPFVRFQSFNLEDKDAGDKTTFTTIGGGATIGWQKMWNSGFVLNLFAGPSYSSVKFKNDSDEDEFDIKGAFKGFGVRTGLTIGFGF
ncbi:MAG TPA: DUF3575 domain-containing protein [Flavisolibacter sp.]|jgi:hypothetical protein|nr:DUF3575 domain-containing protein [Flavisolibacter sp.]